MACHPELPRYLLRAPLPGILRCSLNWGFSKGLKILLSLPEPGSHRLQPPLRQRNLKELDLRECDVDDLSGHWLSLFPENCTSLVSLNIACLGSEISFSALERLVSRCPNLKCLRLNRVVPLDRLPNLLCQAPQLVEFGTGTYTADFCPGVFSNLFGAFSGCKHLKSLSGFWDGVPAYLPAIYPVCSGLTTLNLSYAAMQGTYLIKLINQCPNLQCLWVLDHIEDSGLQALATSCKDLQELRVE